MCPVPLSLSLPCPAQADPSESTNLAGNADYAAILATLSVSGALLVLRALQRHLLLLLPPVLLLQADVKAWQEATADDWVIKYSHQ